MKSLSRRTYIYTETQSGKGICDRKTASMQQHNRSYVTKIHDVITASEIMEALHSHDSVNGCRVWVAEVNSIVLITRRNGLELFYCIICVHIYGIGEGNCKGTATLGQ